MKKWNKILSSLLLLVFVFGFQQSAYATEDYRNDAKKAVEEYIKVTKEENMSDSDAYQWISKYWKDNWMSHYDTDVTSVNVKITKNATTGESIYTVDVYVRVSRTLTEHHTIVTGPGTQKNNYIPELNVLNTQKNPKIEIAIDMADKDVLIRTGFESGELMPSLDNGIGNTGRQELTSEAVYSGSKAIKIGDTYGYGNCEYMWEDVHNESTFAFPETFKYPNGKWFSVTFKIKSNNGTSCNIIGVGGWEDETRVQNAKVTSSHAGSNIVYIDNPEDWWTANGLEVNGKIFTIGRVYMNEKYIKLAEPLESALPVGSNVRIRAWCNPVGFNTRAIDKNSSWRTVSLNTQVKGTDSYDTNIKGFKVGVFNKSHGGTYIDDIKFGKASKVEIMRDNTTLIYSDYGSDVTDINAYAPTTTPSVTSASTNSTTVDFEFKASDTSVTHTYKARSLGSSGKDPSEWSKAYPVTLNSKIQGYSVKVDKNATTDPGTAKNNTDGRISVSGYREGDVVYCHVRAVNQHGVWSSPIHCKYIVKQTAADLKEECSAFAKKLVVDNKSDIASVQAQVTKLRTNTNIPYVVNKVGRTNATKYTKGKVQVTITVDGQSQSSTAPINCKPIYQTEQELKEDITDYIGQTNIHTNSKQLPETLSYNKSQDIDAVKEDIITKCKTNPSLKDIEISFKNTATEFKSGKLEGEIYLKD